LFQAGDEEAPPPRSAGPLPATTPVPAAVASEEKKCASCGWVANPSDVYCPKCGHGLAARAEHYVVCGQCGASVAAPAEFCSKCGKALLKEEDKYRLRTKLQPFDPAVLEPHTPRPAGAPGKDAPDGSVPDRGAPDRGAPDKGAPDKAPSPSSPALRRGEQPLPGPAAGKAVPAGFWVRLVASLVDGFIIALPMMAAGVLSVVLRFGGGLAADGSGTISVPDSVATAGAIVTVLLLIVYPLYFWAVRGSTPGKRLLGLSLVGASGNSPIGMRSAVLRLVGYFLSFVTLGIGFLLVGLTQDKRGLHDRLAETRVVRRRPS
jgi:uncharacterized RDD family membrane protein YckC